MNREMRRFYSRCVLCVGLVAGTGASRLAAQAAAIHPHPGDSIRVRFNAIDVWHTGTVVENPGDTLIISGCEDCHTEYLTPKSIFQIEMKPRSNGTHMNMHVSSGAHVGKAVGIGAGVGLVTGIAYDSRCHFADNNVGGKSKPGCLPVASVVFPVIGATIGLLAGIATRPIDVRVPNDWVPATFSGRTASPRDTESSNPSRSRL